MVRRKIRVAVAMSGGVDSSVAAAILKRQGFEVIGITMDFSLPGNQPVKNARRVANFLGISHRTLHLVGALQKKVIDNFCREYLAGRTPNPCIRCNQYIKFGILLKQAHALGCDYLATGHYARILKAKEGYMLKKGKDKEKEQSYFLYRLTQEKLGKLLFPLGGVTKQEVIKIAQSMSLPVFYDKESQEICFLPDGDLREFFKKRIGKEIRPGAVVDKSGNVLGKHRGIPFYTIGQREGLDIALGYRAYVVNIDASKNRIVLGNFKDAYAREFTVTRLNFIRRGIKKKVVYKVKIRYNHKEAKAEIQPRGKNSLRVRFKQAQFAITCGQSAVFYDGDTVVGGGVIS